MSEKIYSGIVTHDATASATIFTRAASTEEAEENILALARSGYGSFELNDGNTPDDYYFGGGSDDVELVADQIGVKTSEEWDSLERDQPVCWPDNTDQPYLKQRFIDLCHGNLHWAWLLYSACLSCGKWATPELLISESGFVEFALFGRSGNLRRFERLLLASDIVCIDGNLTHLFDWAGDESIDELDAECEVVRFDWSEDGARYSDTLTVGGIAKGRWVDGKFICENVEGDMTTVEFYTLDRIQ